MKIILPIREGVELRTLELKDAKALFDVIKGDDTHLRQWLGWLDDDKTVEDTQKYIEESEKRLEAKEGIDFTIWDGDKIIGGIALYPLDNAHKKTSLMYWLVEDAEGKGIMLDALKVLISYIFEELRLNRVEISCAVLNARSSALPKKLGFKFEGISRQANWLYDHFVDLEVYSLLANEWNK